MLLLLVWFNLFKYLFSYKIDVMNTCILFTNCIYILIGVVFIKFIPLINFQILKIWVLNSQEVSVRI